MQIICTSLHTDNDASTSSLNFHRPEALSDAQPTASKHWRPPTNYNQCYIGTAATQRDEISLEPHDVSHFLVLGQLLGRLVEVHHLADVQRNRRIIWLHGHEVADTDLDTSHQWTSSSAAAERSREPLSQLKSCQLLHNCTKNHIWPEGLPFHVV